MLGSGQGREPQERQKTTQWPQEQVWDVVGDMCPAASPSRGHGMGAGSKWENPSSSGRHRQCCGTGHDPAPSATIGMQDMSPRCWGRQRCDRPGYWQPALPTCPGSPILNLC